MSGKPLRIGMIGLGRAARAHLAACDRFPESLCLTAVCDINEALARSTAQRRRVQAVYSDAFRLIDEGPIDAVDICTPQCVHAAIAVAAARAGKHVLVEKPMACSLDDCLAMVRAAEEAGVVLMVAQNQRYRPQWRAVRDACAAGVIGTVRGIDVCATLNIFQGAAPGHWVYDARSAGGGVMMSFAAGVLDLVRYLVGDIVRVSAVVRTADLRFVGAEDWAAVNLEIAGGAVGQLLVAFSAAPSPWRDNVVIFGDAGTICAAAPPSGRLEPLIALAQEGGEFRPLRAACPDLPGEDMFANQILHFAQCCREGRQPLSSGRDNLLTMQAIFAAYKSAATGSAVEVNSPL